MKKLIKFEETESTYCFKCDSADGSTASFSVKRPGLEFDVKKFYEAFFTGESRFAVLEFQNAEEDWSKEARYVFGVVKSISEDICSRLKPLVENEECTHHSDEDVACDDAASEAE